MTITPKFATDTVGPGYPANLTNQRFGILTVIGPTDYRRVGTRPRLFWQCQCDCGVIMETTSGALKGRTKSCGCLRRKHVSAKMKTHGLSKSPEYKVWANMLSRCNNSNARGFENYGGRGIQVCDRWYNFANFYADMGARPSNDHTIERRNNDGNYTPHNCHWLERRYQGRNKRNTRRVKIGDTQVLVCDLAQKYGQSSRVLRKRLDKGVPPVLAVLRSKRRVP